MSLRIGASNICAAAFALCLALGISTPAAAQISVGIGIALPSVRIGIDVPVYPHLVPVPGYPVYYDPRLDSNFFFYDGVYWDYAQDNWYTSSWYNGPWDLVPPEMVPDFVLRVPVFYYRRPPPYFAGWNREAPPRWGERWGRDWDDHRRGWDRWDRGSIPRAAPLPTYQRQYSRDRYPRPDEQRRLNDRNYHYQPREDVVRRHFDHPPQRSDHPSQRGDYPSQREQPSRREHEPNRAPATHPRDQPPQRGAQQPQHSPGQESPARNSQPTKPRTDKPPG
jgi:hypothetical protein